MKNFRKVLALVLAIATLFSFAAIANASKLPDMAKDVLDEYETSYYEDEAQISDAYYEGVRMLTYVGILNGYEEGGNRTFQPANSIRRNEMAKMIAVLANAGYDVEELYASASSFEDVPADDWAASYVAYCAHTGIVAGRSATTFDPNASVTGLETAKMLLIVLGFNAEQQGYVGADWKVNVLRDAKVMGLLENFETDYNYNAAITREEAAHMMLNALKAPCVIGYLTENAKIRVTNAFIFGDSNNQQIAAGSMYRVDSYATLKDALKDQDDRALYGDVVISNDILSKVLFDITAEDGVNCFGRPGTAWKYNKKTLGVFTYEADFASYNTDVDELEEFLIDYYDDDYEYILTVDGDIPTNGQGKGKTALNAIVDIAETKIGKGVVVEVYVGDDTVRVVIINTYIGLIDDVDMARGTITVAGKKIDNEWGFTPADESETYVLYWICEGGKIHDVEEVEPATATITEAEKEGKAGKEIYSFTADGETYECAKNFVGEPVTDNFSGKGDKEHDIYTDKYGYVMLVKPTNNRNIEIVVLDWDSAKSSDWQWTSGEGDVALTNTADFVYFEEGAPVKTVDTTWDFNKEIVAKHKITDDALVLIDYVDEETITLIGDHEATLGQYDIYLSKDSVRPVSAGEKEGAKDDQEALKYLVDNNTQIIVRVPDYLGDDVDDYTYLYFDGVDEIDAEYVAKDFQYILDNDADAGLDGDGSRYAYIYVDAEFENRVNRAFVLRHLTYKVKLTRGEVVEGDFYEAIVDGEEAVVVYQEDNDRAMVKKLLDNSGVNAPRMIVSDYVKVGMTLNYKGEEIPVWAAVRNAGHEDNQITEKMIDGFLFKNGIMSWNEGTVSAPVWMGQFVDEDCKIWIATRVGNGDEFEAKKVEEENLNDYRTDYGWQLIKEGYCWGVDADENGRYDYVLLVMTEVNPEADALGPHNSIKPGAQQGNQTTPNP